jgi:LacI family transcriptional regulator
VVLIDDRDQTSGQIPSVGTTNHTGAGAAAAHLLAIGRTRPLVLAGPGRFGCTQQRLDGFAAKFADAGHPIGPDRVRDGDFTVERGAAGVHEALDAGLDFDTVFAHNDLSAIGAMQALLDRGKRIPQDVAVVGFDDIPTAAHTQPPLSTVHQPAREMGEAAARTLLAHFEGTPLPNRPTVIPASFIVRGSTVAGPHGTT